MEIRINDRVVKFDPSKIIKALEQSGIYEFKPDGTMVHIHTDRKSGQTAFVPFANFTPIVIRQVKIDDGSMVTSKYEVAAIMNGRMLEPIRVTLKELLGQFGNILLNGGCRYDPDVSNARAWTGDVIQRQCEHVPCTVVFQHLGYAIADGKRVYLNRGYSVTAEGLTDKYTVELENSKLSRYHFVNTRHDGRYKTLLEDLPKVAPESLIYTGLAYVFLSPLNALLRDIGYEPRFILYIIGRTSCHKSTMANLFLCFFGLFRESEPAPISFGDTENQGEKTLALVDSAPTLLDDRYQSVTKVTKTKMSGMEQRMARAVGDRAGRGRMNADGSSQAVYRPKGNLIVTAEEAFEGVGESAIARSIACELKPDDVKLAPLTTVQNKAYELNECMSEYIQYVLIHWDDLADKCGKMFLEYRDKAQNGGHGRLAVAVAHLQIGFSIMCDWLVSVKAITESESEALRAKAWAVFMELSAEQNRRVFEEKPSKLFTDAIREMIDMGDIVFFSKSFKGAIDGGTLGTKKHMGYRDDNFFYAKPSDIYIEVCKFFDAQGKGFPLSKTALWRQLADEGLIIPGISKDGKKQTTKTATINGESARYLTLKKRAIYPESEDTET